MSAVLISAHGASKALSWLDKERSIAGPGFNRWLIPPAALAVHLCIGTAYGVSMVWLPLSRALGIDAAKPCPADLGLLGELFTTRCDWRISSVGWTYTLFFVTLGLSATLWGRWLERVGPRKAGVVAALCWSGGLAVSALGVALHQLWLMWLGSGVIGGTGLGLGYISPMSTLIKWFPDKRGMATGMAIMGFGGGAMIGSPLAADLIRSFASTTSVRVAQTLFVMTAIDLALMLVGALGYRIPADGWRPSGWIPPVAQTSAVLVTDGHMHVRRTWHVPEFSLVCMVLCTSVSAGIGIIGLASPMLQEVFGGQLFGVAKGFADFSKTELASIAGVAAGFTALLSLFNIGGRFIWATLSDRLSRRWTYVVFFVLGGALYASAPASATMGSKPLSVVAFCVILSMYGGGFATVPAYLADFFGTQMVGTIHGRLLTAWAAAGIIGPVVVNCLLEYQVTAGVSRDQGYDNTMYMLVTLLAVGLICNLMIRPVAEKWFITASELAQEQQFARDTATGLGADRAALQSRTPLVGVVLAWIAVGLPLAWGVYRTLLSSTKFLN